MAKKEINIWKNGATVRMHNKEINFVDVKDKDGIVIQLKYADLDADKPAVSHKCIKGKVRVSEIALSHEAMQSLLIAYNAYMQKKLTLSN